MKSYNLDELVSHAGTTSTVNVPHEMFQQMYNMIELNVPCYIDVYHDVDNEQLRPADRKRVNRAINDLAILAATTQASIAALGRNLCDLHLAEFIISMVGPEAFVQAHKHGGVGALK